MGFSLYFLRVLFVDLLGRERARRSTQGVTVFAHPAQREKDVRSLSEFQARTIVRRLPALWKAVRLLRRPGIQH